MKVREVIDSIFRRGSRVFNGNTGSFIGGWSGSCYPFADAVFLNICELLTDLCRDVSWSFDGSNPALEASFIRFFNTYGQVVLNKMYRDGIVVIGHTQQGEGAAAAHEFHLCTANEYRTSTHNEWVDVVPMVPGLDVYALRSATFQTTGRSDKAVLQPFLSFLDNTLNASNTISERMGAFVVASPKNLTSSPVPSILNEKDKAALESQISEEYGALHKQKQVMVLPREMSWQVISLAQLDLKTQDKAKMAVLAIADRIKVPANQIGFIDANSSKSLANGTELREGDFNKYQSFERLLDGTFVQMARDCGLRAGVKEMNDGMVTSSYYSIYNKPKRNETI